MSLGAILALVAAAAALLALSRSGDARVSMPSEGGPPASVESHILSGHKIAAIKLYREQNGVGLKEAKEAVEAIERTLPRH